MTEHNDSPVATVKEKGQGDCRHRHACNRKHSHWHKAIVGVLAIVGVISVTNIAFGNEQFDGRHHPGAHPVKAVMHMLDNVNASDAQREQVKTIFDAHAASLKTLHESGRELQKQMRTLLYAPTIDRAAIEEVRQKKVANMDQTSREMTAMMADVSEVLTPDQRQQVADRVKERMQDRFEQRRDRRN